MKLIATSETPSSVPYIHLGYLSAGASQFVPTYSPLGLWLCVGALIMLGTSVVSGTTAWSFLRKKREEGRTRFERASLLILGILGVVILLGGLAIAGDIVLSPD